MNMPRVTVLGSVNMDISVTVAELPGPGATVLGGAARFTPGGKGANQAVAAARLGASVRMVGCVGQDDFGQQLVEALTAEGIDTAAVAVLDGVPSGLAMITVDAAGENMITVAPGANHEVSHAQVGDADVLVISAEIPLAVVRQALSQQALGRQQKALGEHQIVVLNLAPAPPEADAAEIVGHGVDWLVVNETEAAAVLGTQVHGLDGARQAAAGLVAAGALNAVVTAGSHGAALASATEGAVAVPGFPVTAVDSVGAGDTFVGALAVALAAGVPPRDAVTAASAAAAAKVTRHGAQAGMPRPVDILAVTGITWPVDGEGEYIVNSGRT
jgi:ribokinase